MGHNSGKSKHLNINIIFKFLLLIILPFNLSANQKYTVQVAASKTPLNISDFAKTKKIDSKITEYNDAYWYRYFIGSFESYKSADSLSRKLLESTLLKRVFITNLPSEISDNFYRRQLSPEKTALSDSIQEKSLPRQDNNIQETEGENPALSEAVLPAQNQEVKSIDPGGFYERFINYVDKKIIGEIKTFITGKGETIEGISLGNIFILFLMIFILNILFVLLIFVFSNRRQNYNIRYNDLYRENYESVLLTYILGEATWDETVKRLKNLDKPQNRELLCSILMNFNENLKGSTNRTIPEIFVKLGLHFDAMKQAKSKLFYLKVIGIRKLSHLYPEGAKEIVAGLLNHPDDIIREEAQSAYVRVNPEDPFGFLKILEKPFTRWAQISAFYIFKLHQLQIVSFGKYLESTNKNVRNFSLRMVIFFQQLENTNDIILLLDSPLEMTRGLAIKAVNDLRIYNGKIKLRENFESETQKNKIEIIKALRNIGDEGDFDFLETIIKADNITLKTEACRSLYFMNEMGKERLLNLNNKITNGLELYIAHVTDPRN